MSVYSKYAKQIWDESMISELNTIQSKLIENADKDIFAIKNLMNSGFESLDREDLIFIVSEFIDPDKFTAEDLFNGYSLGCVLVAVHRLYRDAILPIIVVDDLNESWLKDYIIAARLIYGLLVQVTWCGLNLASAKGLLENINQFDAPNRQSKEDKIQDYLQKAKSNLKVTDTFLAMHESVEDLFGSAFNIADIRTFCYLERYVTLDKDPETSYAKGVPELEEWALALNVRLATKKVCS